MQEILSAKDQIKEQRQLNCLEVMIEDNRVDLVYQYLRRRYPKVEILGGLGASQTLGECKIEIIESDIRDEIKNQKGLGQKTIVSRGEIKSNSGKRSTMRLAEDRWGSLRFDQDSIEIKCIKKPRFIEIDIRMDSPQGMISTSVQVQPGEEFDLGQTVQDLAQKTKDISTQKGYLETKTSGIRTRSIKAVIR